jgi:hypothetical protein
MGDFAHSQAANLVHGTAHAHAALHGLPDERTAQRLLDVLAQLEHTLANARPVAVKAPAQTNARQHQALQRLDGLIAQLEAHLAANGAANIIDALGESPPL